MAYADESDYEAYVYPDTAPDNVTKLLRHASEWVDAAVIQPYDTDEYGDPTDTDIITAFRNAVCAQVEFWSETGDDKGLLSRYSSVSVGSLSLSGGKSKSGGSTQLCPRAIVHLRNAGLLNAGISDSSPSAADRFFA